MTDQELLELAAKAAGFESPSAVILADGTLKGLHVIHKGSVIHYWHPLADDGDALRLAAQAGLVVSCDGRGIEAKTVDGAIPSAWAVESEYGPPDHMARIRRAIVRAAAEIGRAMQ
jgi:hypothetical protein